MTDAGDCATQWVADHLAFWHPVRNGRFYLDAAAVVGEVGALWWLRTRDASEGRLEARLRAFVEAAIGEPAFHERLGRFPRDLPLYLPPFLVLKAAGAFEPYRPYLQAILDNGWSRTSEMLPYRLVELRYFADKLALRHRLPSLRTLAARTVLMDAPSPAIIADAECYALAHAILYLTDFGHHPEQFADRPHVVDLESFVGALIGVNAIDGNYDLVCELLLAAACLPMRRSYELNAAITVIQRAQAPEGSVPSRRSVKAEDTNGAQASRAMLHSSLVFAMACTVWSRR